MHGCLQGNCLNGARVESEGPTEGTQPCRFLSPDPDVEQRGEDESWHHSSADGDRRDKKTHRQVTGQVAGAGTGQNAAAAMMGRNKSFFYFWRKKKERGALLERANQLRLLPSQQKRLLGDSGVRTALQGSRVASLLPPVGTEVFRRFGPASLQEIQHHHEAENKEAEKDPPKPAADLEAGKPLPFFYGDPPPELLHTPLEELDPFYQSEKTFMVLGRGNIIHRFDAKPSCFLLSPSNPLRTVAVKILTHSLFSLFMLVTILINCVFMTMTAPPEWTMAVEYVFVVIYTLEVIVKVVSRGFCVGKFTFIRDPWNSLDLLIITTSYLSIFVDFGRFLRFFQVFGSTIPRVLKILPLIPGMRMTVRALVQSLKKLLDVAVVMLFVLSVLAVISMHLFMGFLRSKCVMTFPWLHGNQSPDITPTPEYFYIQSESSDFDYNKYLNNKENLYFLPGQLDPLLCGNRSDAGVCPEGYTCIRAGKNPNYGFTSFDTFGWSLLSHVRLMLQDFWDNLFFLTLRASGKSSLAYFMVFVFPGSFYVLALVIVVVAMVSSRQEEVVVAAAKQKEDEFSQIVEALKRGEEEEPEASRAEPSQIQDGAKESVQDHSSCPQCWLIFVDRFLKWNCCGCWRALKQRVYTVVTNPFFDLGICICLIINVLFMAMEHYPMTMEFFLTLVSADLVFTVIFAVEMFLKLVAFDPHGYFRVGWNIFDSIIVITSVLELGVADIEGLSVLRTFKLMRVVRLARWWPCFFLLIRIMWTCLSALRNLSLLLVLVVFLFSVVGLQLFRRDYQDCVCRIAHDCELPRWHMTDFYSTFLLIVRALFGDWIESLWDCMEVSGKPTCLIFFMVLVVVGNLLILNLFLTLLLSSFSCDILPIPGEKEKSNVHIAVNRIMRAVCRNKSQTKPDHTGVDSKDDNRKDYLALDLVTSEESVSEVKEANGNHDNVTPHRQAPIATGEIKIKEKRKHPEVLQNKDDQDGKPEDCCCHRCYRCCPLLDIDTSQGAGKVWSNFRRACLCIVQNLYFDAFMILIIMLSSGALMFEDIYLPQRDIMKTVIRSADQVFTYLFLLEMLLKWVAFGLKRYFSDAWCWLDFLILDVFLLSLVADMLGLSGLVAVSSLKTLRAAAPLRILSRFPSLKALVQDLLRAIPPMLDVLLVLLTVCLIFCIFGTNVFAGKFYYCFNETAEEVFVPGEVDNKSECLSLIMHNFTEVRWKNHLLNFDNIHSGYLSMLHLGASADWMDVMYAAVDSTEVESQPVYQSRPSMYLYYIFFVIVISFFTFNLFIRGLMDHLQRDKIRTEHQQKYSRPVKKPQEAVPRPQNRCQAGLFDVVTSPYFDVAIVVVLLLYLLSLMMDSQDISDQMYEILYFVQFAFINLFLIEFILKVIALRKYYFKDCMNILDLVVLLICICGIFIYDFIAVYFINTNILPMVRLVRISRILHISRCTRRIRKMLFAFARSFFDVFIIAVLCFVLTSTFAIFGMFNFAYVKKEFAINDMFNFETFGNSMICMFTVTMSGSWAGLLLPMLHRPPDCDPYMDNPGSTVRGNCGNRMLGITFFCTYICLSFLLTVYMYITVLLEAFRSEDTEALSDDDLQMFYRTWRDFDPDASQFIQYSRLSDFCDTLKDPLRIPKPNTMKLIHMDLPMFPGDTVHCEDILLALAAQVTDDSAEIDSLKARMEEKFKAKLSKASCEPISSTLRRKQEEVAAKVIQRAFRKGLLQRGDGAETPGAAAQSAIGGASGSSQPGEASE